MSFLLAWIDHDEKTRARTQELLSSFLEEESRDELGIGAIRDSIADKLFPGTSTIQTRLRYFLFVPWMYRTLERKKLKFPDFGEEADRMERKLILAILASDDTEGAFGRKSRDKIKRLPSSVYWAGLEAWGIRCLSLSQNEYHRRIDEIYECDDDLAEDWLQNGGRCEKASIWHAGLPESPDNFPKKATFSLRREEAEYLRDRIVETHPNSLLAYLAASCDDFGLRNVPFVWEHSCYGTFSGANRELLEHAKYFSEAIYGAILAYNYYLSNHRNGDDDPKRAEDYRQIFIDWYNGLDTLANWNLDVFWVLVTNDKHLITSGTKEFVQNWVAHIKNSSDAQSLLHSEKLKRLIVERERALKKGKSRFMNEKALQQWSGASGLNKLDYRWHNVKVLLEDLYAGLKRENHA